jgi:metal-responsive CopG/Arc/MetJ family transcriptional regulator
MAQVIHIRISLSGDLAVKFEWLKKYLGLKNNSEVMRQALVKAYQCYLLESQRLEPLQTESVEAVQA